MSRGYFGVVAYHPRHEANVGTLWRSATAYGAKFVGTVGRRYERQASDTAKTALHTPLVHYASIDDLIAHLPHGCRLVGVELTGDAVSLDTFDHPDRAVYILGAEDHGLPRSVLDRCHYIVQIPSMVDWSLNVATAGSIVLWDRFTTRRAPVAV